MALIVQKFGGTSVADADKIHRAARRAIRAKLDGKKVVLVVSAMGKTTDDLVYIFRLAAIPCGTSTSGRMWRADQRSTRKPATRAVTTWVAANSGK